MNKTYLLSGATGFIGKNLLSSTLFKTSLIYCLVRNQAQEKTLQYLHPNLRFIYPNDLTNHSVLKEKLDAVIHLAAYGVNNYQKDVEEMVQTNIILSIRLLDFAKAHQCKLFLNFGSAFEFDSQNAGQLINEHTIANPINLYGITKYTSGMILKSIAKDTTTKLLTLRLFSLYGKNEHFSRLFPLIINTGITKKKLALTAGEQLRDYLYVNDLIKLIFQIIHNSDSIQESILNLCTSKPISIKDFIQTIIKVNQFEPTLFLFGENPYRANEAMQIIGDNQLLLKYFPDFKFTSFEQGITESSNFYYEMIKIDSN
jgi:nucleoside-diphosphate-sugar epimerase